MKSVRVKCPAKINLNLKVLGKREDGFHNIESLMQTIDLYDYLKISVCENPKLEINLSGSSSEIPYDERNLVYKAAKLFFDKTCIDKVLVEVYIEKNIPVSAGLAGGSTNAAGMLFGLNILFDELLNENELLEMCANLGSDLNFCLKGGCMLTEGRGEILTQKDSKFYNVSLIKPMDLGISAKEAYTKFSNKKENEIDLDSRNDFVNDLEWAVLSDYSQLQKIKEKYPEARMTGSGSTYYLLDSEFEPMDGYWVKNRLKTIITGVEQF